MRLLHVAPWLLLLSATACDTFPVPIQPELKISPYFAAYQLRGFMAMQSDPVNGPIDNPQQSLRQFGFDNYEDDVGVRADFGDGFAGVRLDYYRLDQYTSRNGTLSADFGNLLAGDMVRMSATMDEFRLGWNQELWSYRGSYRESQVDLHFGAGLVYAQRDLTMRARTDDGLRNQNIGLSGGNIYPAARFRGGWRDVTLDLEYAISPHLDIGGDYGGVQQDFETRFSYQVPFQDIVLFAGFRYTVLDGSAVSEGLRYDADLRLDGFQLGFMVTF